MKRAAEGLFQHLAQAYAVLGDEAARKKYDATNLLARVASTVGAGGQQQQRHPSSAAPGGGHHR